MDQGIGEVGCDFLGEVFDLRIMEAEGHDKAYWEQRRDNFDQFTPNQVGSHEGISGIGAGAQGQGICRQIIAVDGGSVITEVTFVDVTGAGAADPCSKALEIAQQVEPKLPA